MGNASSSTNEKSPQEESKMSEVADNLKEDAKGVDEVKKRTSNMVKAAKGEAGEEENTGSRVLVALAVLSFAWGSGYLAAKDEIPAWQQLLGGEKPTLESKPTHRFIWLQSSNN